MTKVTGALADEVLAQWEADSRDCPEPISLDRKILELIEALRRIRNGRSKATEQALTAGFETGWAAACLQISEGLALSHAPPEVVAGIRRWASEPPPVQILEGNKNKIPVDAEIIFKSEVALQDGGITATVIDPKE